MKGATLVQACMMTILGLTVCEACSLQSTAIESTLQTHASLPPSTIITLSQISNPFEEIFQLDLIAIAASVPGIESIIIESYLDMRPSQHLWAFLKINYINVNTLLEKINLQYYVQETLEAKWYIETAEPNYIIVIPEQPSPWPGFAVGDVNVAFIQEYWNPAADVDHDFDVDIFDIVLAAAAYGSTYNDVTWNPDCDIVEVYGVIDIYDLVVIASNYGAKFNP